MTMASKELEADDPMEFVAMRFPAPAGVDVDAGMARTFIEEFALMGMSRHKVMNLFRSQFFAGTNTVLEARGEDFVKALIAEVFGSESPVEAQ